MPQDIGPIEILFFAMIAFILIAVGIYSYYFIRAMVSKDAPYVGSFNSQLNLMKEKLKLDTDTTLLDLGCGDGKALRVFAKHHGIKKCIGYDINLFAILRGKILNKVHRQKNIKLQHKNFSKAEGDIQKADYIYLYLFPKQMKQLEETIKKEKKSDCVIVANTFQFSDRNPSEIITNGKDKIYLYK